MSTAYAEYGTGEVTVEFPYNDELIEEIKANIPPFARSWDGTLKVWTFADEVWSDVKDIIEGYYPIMD